MNDLLERMTRLGAALCALMIIVLAVPATPGGSPFVATALADDDDDGGDDDGDDGGSAASSGSRDSGSRRWKPRKSISETSRRPVRAQPRRPAMADFARSELVARGLTGSDIARLLAEGYEVLNQATLGASGETIHRLRIPQRLTLQQARSDVATAAAQASVDLNHYYRPNEAESCTAKQCLARQMIGWAPVAADAKSCSTGIRIGMIDTAINADHAALAGSRIDVTRLADDKLPASSEQHGTAVAALLVGNAEGRSPGLLPGAELIAVDTFHRRGGKADISDVYSLVKALDYLESRDVSIINMSLAGPANAVLEETIKRVSAAGILLVAAAGNDGPKARPVYPAAYEEVIAVTAVDRQKRPYRRAVRGPHIDLAAPGVDVWIAASRQGSRPRTGTSFAAPFVTAALALARKHDPAAQEDAALMRMTERAEDLGAPGRDDIFGWGLLNPAGLCG